MKLSYATAVVVASIVLAAPVLAQQQQQQQQQQNRPATPARGRPTPRRCRGASLRRPLRPWSNPNVAAPNAASIWTSCSRACRRPPARSSSSTRA